MAEMKEIKIGEEFRPARQFKKLYYIYLMLAILFGILPWFLPVFLFAPFPVIIGFLIPILAILIFVSNWIPKYCDTMLYKLTQNEIVWRRGVYFKKTGIVPYNRITNIDIVQGPISRSFGIASIKIQTAGYSGPSGGGRMAEIRIDGMEQFEELRELIMGFVRSKKPLAVETYEEDISLRILDELVKMREMMEKST